MAGDKQVDETDEILMERIVDQDREAFRQLSDKYMKMLFSAAYRLGAGREEAEDIVQESLLRVWQKAD